MTIRNLRQTITYWAPTNRDAYGKTQFAAPVQLQARWEDKVQVIQNQRGQEVVSKARVYLSEGIETFGYMYLGSSNATDPMVLEGAQEIQLVGMVPDLRSLNQLHMAYV